MKDSFAFAQQATETITAQNAFEEIEERDGTNTRASIAAFSLAHTNDHYGQMIEYLRMNGIIPPAQPQVGRFRPYLYRFSTATYFTGYSGPMYSARGRISRLSSSCSMTCAAQPEILLTAKIGVNKSRSIPSMV